MRFVRLRRRLVALACLTLASAPARGNTEAGQTASAGAIPAPSRRVKGSPGEWEIRPDGLGRLDGQSTMYVPEARAAYPEATVSVERGHAGDRGNDGVYFVFRVRGEELFRTNCWCDLAPDGSVRFGERTRSVIREADVWMQPITDNPRYRTSRGVGVGSTVAALARAYREYGKPHYSVVFAGSVPEYESVCFFAGEPTRGARAGTVEMIRFYVKPPRGRRTAGRLGGQSSSTRVDPRATVVAVQPLEPCHPWQGP